MMEFDSEQLHKHDELVRKQTRTEVIALLDDYAANYRRQGLMKEPSASNEFLRGSMETCMFIASVLSMQNK